MIPLSPLPEAAFSAKQFEQAHAASKKLIKLAAKYPKSSLYGGAINKAHTVLGRLALSDDDIEAAKKHLSLSIINIASPTMCSFGPSLELASELQQTFDEFSDCCKQSVQQQLICKVG